MSYGYELAMEKAGAKIFAYKQFGSYSGDWWAKVEYEGKTYWIHDWYGSCSGCDSFEAEFAFSDNEKCIAHRYQHNSPLDCSDCAKTLAEYNRRLAEFGRKYLIDSETHDQDSAESKAAEFSHYDSDAAEVIAFIKANAL